MANISLNDMEDTFTLDGQTKNGQIIVKEAYNFVMPAQKLIDVPGWFEHMWKWNFSLKLKCFCWLICRNKILTVTASIFIPPSVIKLLFCMHIRCLI